MRSGKALQRRTPLAAGTSSLRRTPFNPPAETNARHRPTKQATPAARETPRRPRRSLEVPVKVRANVYERDGHRCQACGAPGPLTIQHRDARGMGGTTDPATNRPSNLVTLCGSGSTGCHGHAEGHPIAAATAGWRIPAGVDPTEHPYRRFDGALVLLADDYTIELTEAAA